MDGPRFDTFTRSLTAARSRRAAVGVALGSALGLLGVHPEQAEAHNPLKKCKKINDKQKRRACIKKAKKHNATHTVAAPAPTGTAACTPNCSGGRNCGGDGCSGSCGSCSGTETCGGGGAAGVCGCTPTTCAAQGKNCGTIADGCGGTPDCGTCGTGQRCAGGTCQEICAAYGASACETPNTTCDANSVTCGGDPFCWAMPTTSGCCACATSPSRSHQTCTSSQDCLGAARCDDSFGEGICSGDWDLPCTTDADCASLATCRDGACGGQICTTDAHCEALLGPGTVCISGEALPCTAGGANICWTLCTGA